MKLKNLLTEAESFTATNKKTGKTSVFKTKDTRDAAVKAGTHAAIKEPKAGGKSKSGVNIFDKPAAGVKKGKDDKSKSPAMKHTKVGEDSLEVKTISNFTNLRAKALADFINKNKLDATAIANFVKKGSLRDRMDIGTAIVGNPGNKYEKKVIKQFGAKEEEPKSKSTAAPASLGVDKVVYNTRTKTVGIVRMADERGETKTDADGNVNTSELEPYNPMKYPHQKDAKVAPSTKKEVDARGLWNPFSTDNDEPKSDTPVSKPKEARKGNPQVNVAAKKTAEKYGITPQKLGNEKYKEAMFQAAVSALTDSNYHSEARELVAAIEGKPEFAKRPEYPSIKDPKYKEKMADIRKNSADGSVYMNGTGDIDDYGTDVSQAAGWDGVDAADGIAFTLRMNGFHKEADMIQSVFNDKPYMKDSTKESKTSLKSIMRK